VHADEDGGFQRACRYGYIAMVKVLLALTDNRAPNPCVVIACGQVALHKDIVWERRRGMALFRHYRVRQRRAASKRGTTNHGQLIQAKSICDWQ